jgi:hypothetical protein
MQLLFEIDLEQAHVGPVHGRLQASGRIGNLPEADHQAIARHQERHACAFADRRKAQFEGRPDFCQARPDRLLVGQGRLGADVGFEHAAAVRRERKEFGVGAKETRHRPGDEADVHRGRGQRLFKRVEQRLLAFRMHGKEHFLPRAEVKVDRAFGKASPPRQFLD